MADIKRKKKSTEDEKKKKSDADNKNTPEKNKKPFAYHLIPYVFALLAIFFLLCFITNAICNPGNKLDGGSESQHTLGVIGFYLCEISMGLFGPGAYSLPVLMIIFVIFWRSYDKRSFVKLNLVILFISLVLISALSHVILHAREGIAGFTTNIQLLYGEGSILKGGGIIGGYLGYAAASILNIVGSIFVFIA